MTRLEEIRSEIERLDEELMEIIHKAYFTLNQETEHIYARIDELQAECTHDFDDDGVCVYCGKIRTLDVEDEK